MVHPVVMDETKLTIRHSLDCPILEAKKFAFRETYVLKLATEALRDQWIRELKSEV